MMGLRRSSTIGGVALTAAALVLLAACSGTAGTGSATSNGTSSPTATGGASSRDVSFSVDGTTTYGTLEMPAHAAGRKLAAALLIPGSGPTDRDGNQPPHAMPNTLRLIAEDLAGQGVISLRFDKYFSGKTGAGAFAGHPGTSTLQDFITQADAAYRFLSQQPGVDTRKLLVVGHSLGGMYALLIAESVTPRPAGLALMEPADQRMLDTIQVQIDELLNAQVAHGQLTTAAAKQNAALVGQAITDFRAGQPVSLAGIETPLLPVLESVIKSPSNDTYDRSDDLVYPPAVAAKLASGTRVLVTDGTADSKILPSTIGPLVTALHQAGTTGPGFRRLADVNHDLFAGTATTGSSLDPQVTAALAAWAQPYASPG
jgi:hypothetical protein